MIRSVAQAEKHRDHEHEREARPVGERRDGVVESGNTIVSSEDVGKRAGGHGHAEGEHDERADCGDGAEGRTVEVEASEDARFAVTAIEPDGGDRRGEPGG